MEYCERTNFGDEIFKIEFKSKCYEFTKHNQLKNYEYNEEFSNYDNVIKKLQIKFDLSFHNKAKNVKTN